MKAKAARAAARIPLSFPHLGEREEELVIAVLRSGRLSLGPMVDRFERLFAERVGARHAAAVSSGTAGLPLAVRLAGVGPGDEVITSPFSFVASANCVIYEGARPVFADVDPRTLTLDPAAVEAAVTGRTRAVVAVDMVTPTTIRRYTGHENGAVYGAPDKRRDGRTHLENLFLCGTDQGLVGIIGAILSGITVANRYCLRA